MSARAEQDSKNNGRWTKEEHDKFILGLQLYGKDWRKIQALIGSRNGAQIRSHAQKYFIKNKKDADTFQSHENSQHNFQSPEHLQQNSSLGLSMVEPETNPDYSYYLNKIVQNDALKESFDFWDCLVDHKQVSQFEITGGIRRKESFVSLYSDKDEMMGCEPVKKVKTE